LHRRELAADVQAAAGEHAAEDRAVEAGAIGCRARLGKLNFASEALVVPSTEVKAPPAYRLVPSLASVLMMPLKLCVATPATGVPLSSTAARLVTSLVAPVALLRSLVKSPPSQTVPSSVRRMVRTAAQFSLA
jgi:hypothetical protein